MRILVTGGAGFIGSFVVEGLLSAGYSVTVLDVLDPQVHGTDQLDAPSGARQVRGDIRDRRVLLACLQDVHAVIHCAAAVGTAQSVYRVHRYVDVNVGGTALLLELLAESPGSIDKLILLTSMTSYGEGAYRRSSDGKLLRVGIRSIEEVRKHGWDPVCPETGEAIEPVPTPEDVELMAGNVYALTKRYQEELALNLGRLHGFPVVCLRLFNVYGPRQSLTNPYTGVLAIFLSRLLAGRRPVIYEDGSQTRDFVSVHDVVKAVMAALESSQVSDQVINVGSGIPRRIVDCARSLSRLMGRDAIEPEITGKYRKGDVRHCFADIAKAGQLLRYRPSVEWEEGLTELVRWTRGVRWEDHCDQAQQELWQRNLLE